MAVICIGLLTAAIVVATGIGYDKLRAARVRNKHRGPRHLVTRVRTPAEQVPSLLRRQAH